MSQAPTQSPGVQGASSPLDASLQTASKPVAFGVLMRRILKPVASLRLTVVLFVFSMLLVFFGTMAQKYSGIWTVVDQYFWSFIVWVPVQLIIKFGQIFLGFPGDWMVSQSVSFPLPGGKILGFLLFFNLVAAHLTRFKISWKRSGILLTHAGLILMFFGEVITRTSAVEGNLPIPIGESSNLVFDSRNVELVVIEPLGDVENITAVPQSKLRVGNIIRSEHLPFDIQVKEFYKNSTLGLAKEQVETADNPATAGDGRRARAIPRREINGTDQDPRYDTPSAYVKLTGKNGEDLGTYLVSTLITDAPMLYLVTGDEFWDVADQTNWPRQTVKVGDKTYQLGMRFQRRYMPFSIQLDEFKYEVYPGTNMAKNYESDIHLKDPDQGVDRELVIKMNQPLRHRGQAFYQQNVLPFGDGTVLQVVRNPGWLLPYASCAIVALGMLIHFGITLNGYLERRAA